MPVLENSVAAIVVTYNRRELLLRCLTALIRQTMRPRWIIVVDNASTDGTHDEFSKKTWSVVEGLVYLRLEQNLGGAGGFSAGISAGLDAGASWIWLMDDDAEAQPDALEQLVAVAANPLTIYGSLAVSGDNTSWDLTLVDDGCATIGNALDVPTAAKVASLPFLGFMIHRDAVEAIGLPDAGFFIAADDVEYCLRASKSGMDIVIAGKSRIEHPKSQYQTVRVFGRNLVYLDLPAWKRYYDTRNRLLIAKKYYGSRLIMETIPGTLIRMLVALRRGPRRALQLRAMGAGFVDGLLGMKGRRHGIWGLEP